ncbi:MAG: hypothetical protein IKP96_02030 [Elusimicrobiaceae bacterium]|nr:hypothetical protein [Elusimicrobiaceae bacterium]
MKALSYILAIICLISPFGLHAQNLPKAVSRAGKAATKGVRVSVAGYFHQLGSGKLAEREAAIPPLVDPDLRRKVSVAAHPFQKRSLESLQLEAQKLGLAPHNLETYSREQLEDFITSYKGLHNMGRNVRVRWETPQGITSGIEKEFLQRSWAETQPDYFRENYLDNLIIYTEPWNPVVKSLNILVVNDELKYLSALQEAADESTQVHVAGVRSVKDAIELLKNIPYAFDVILTDMAIGEGDTGEKISMYVWNQRLNIPVIWYSAENLNDAYLLSYNVVGRIGVAGASALADEVFRYLSNIVATGRAYPNGKPEEDEEL